MVEKKSDIITYEEPANDRAKAPLLGDDAAHLRLILKARDGDSNAFEQLAAEYSPMLSSAVSQYRGEVGAQDFEEIEQEALLAFHRAVMKYDILRRDVKFGLYARVCVNKAIISALRKITLRKKHYELVPIDDATEVGTSCPADSVIERENERALRKIIRDNLSDFENTVWWQYYAGVSTDEIARRTGRSKKSVGNAITRVRRKLRTILEHNKQDQK